MLQQISVSLGCTYEQSLMAAKQSTGPKVAHGSTGITMYTATTHYLVGSTSYDSENAFTYQ